MENLTVYKSNTVIEAGYRLDMNELRVLLACIGQLDSRSELNVADKFELTAKDFSVMFAVSDSAAYQVLAEVATKLLKRYITIENPFPDKPKINRLQTHWISAVYYMQGEGKIALSFAPEIIPYLSNLQGKFTRYDLKNISRMRSIYGVRLYELLMQWKNVGTREIEVGWLKKKFEIESKYSQVYDLKKYVIDPAVNDINAYSDFSVTWEQKKTGRVVSHFIFKFKEKTAPAAVANNSAIAKADKPEPITLTEEQLNCFQWAKSHSHWTVFTNNKKSFVTCFNADVEGGLKDQWMATLPKAQKPKPEKTAADKEREENLRLVNLRNELANLQNLNKLSPNAALEQQIENLKLQLGRIRPN